LSLAERKDRVRHYHSQGLSLVQALEAFEVTRHQYYYRPQVKATGGGSARPGHPPTTCTRYHETGGQITLRPNAEVVEKIQEIQCDDDLRCGYKRMTGQLHLEGYEINAKKVYRLMRANDLLLSRLKKSRGPYVAQRCAQPDEPLTLFEMDIKMIWVEEHRRYVYVFTILDTFTRMALHWTVAYSIRWPDVRRAWEEIIENHLQPADALAKEIHIEIRSDNGPQFLAKSLREFFAENHLAQVFTHPYTPQENGHVESFHAILATALRHEFFWTLDQLTARLAVFYDKYNNDRVHSATALLPPRLFWEAYENDLVVVRKDKRKRNIFRLKLPRYFLAGNLNPEGASRFAGLRFDTKDRQESIPEQEDQMVSGAVT
jgi:transposase InsO family protein